MALIFFDRHDATFGTELWVTDGSPGGTHRVTDLNPGAGSSNPTWLTAARGRVFFLASDGTSTDLYVADGTSVVPLTTGSSTFIGAYDFVDVNGTVYFDAIESFGGGISNSIWKSDGTVAGTGPVAGDPQNGSAGGPNYLANALGTLFFIAA